MATSQVHDKDQHYNKTTCEIMGEREPAGSVVWLGESATMQFNDDAVRVGQTKFLPKDTTAPSGTAPTRAFTCIVHGNAVETYRADSPTAVV